MSPKQKQRLILVSLLVVGLGSGIGLVLMALNENINLFFTPTQIVAGEVQPGNRIRIGGLVLADSVDRNPENLQVHFVLTDTVNQISVSYDGILPDLFREGQGIVANGKLQANNVFIADEVLAKHDENYMAPEVAQALQEAGAEIPHPTYQTAQ